MQRRVHTDNAPAAIGPYSQAIVINSFVFAAGQIPINPATHKLVEGGIEEQTRQVLDNVKAVLEAAGSSLRSVVKTTVFLTYLGNFAAMNAIYAEYFNADPPPARSTVQVADLPLGAMIEIECIAALEQEQRPGE
jgi:2-iminobutanoate/2-iminopropanoate deaminase